MNGSINKVTELTTTSRGRLVTRVLQGTRCCIMECPIENGQTEAPRESMNILPHVSVLMRDKEALIFHRFFMLF